MRWRVICATMALSLSACAAAPDLIGLGAGGAAGGVTANPAVALAVGITTRAIAREALGYAKRTRQHTRQQSLADAAPMAGQDVPAVWEARHTAGIGDSTGEVQLIRQITTPLAVCQEVALRVEGEDVPYITVVCPRGDGWAWANAEPAVPRWGSLQ